MKKRGEEEARRTRRDRGAATIRDGAWTDDVRTETTARNRDSFFAHVAPGRDLPRTLYTCAQV